MGTVTVWLIVCLSVIFSILALGMDGGRLMEERRRAQAAADAAALAAAADLFLNYRVNQGADPSGTAQTAALNSAAANGYANDGVESWVTVNIPPQVGAFAGQKDHVEVIVQSTLPGSFSALFTQDPLPVQARAVARGRYKRIGLLLLQSQGDGALSVSGNASITAVNAPIVANSTSAAVYQISGNGSVSAAYHDLAGSVAPRGPITGPINTSVPPAADPLRSLPEPNPAGYPVCSGGSSCGNSQTLQPGVYPGGLQFSGNDDVTLLPGIYIMDGGGFQVSGNANVSGNGVMIYNGGGSNCGSISIAGNGTVNLQPPTEGPYAGIGFFQQREATATIHISGNGSVQITGTVYAPTALIDVSGNGSSDSNRMGGGYIASQVQVSGNGNFTVEQGNNRPRVPEVGLVE